MATTYNSQPEDNLLNINKIKTDKKLLELAFLKKYDAYNERLNKLRTKYNLFITDGSQISSPLCSSTSKPY